MAEGTKLDGAPLAVIEVDTTSRVSAWNQRAAQIFGVTRSEAIGRELDALLPTGTAGAWSQWLAGDGASGPRVWPIRRGASELYFETWSERQVDGTRLYGHDVSQRVIAARRAALESTILAAIKDYLEIELWAIDAAGTLLYHDGQSRHTGPTDPHPRTGTNIFDLPRDGAHHDDIRRALAGEPRTAIPGAGNGAHWQDWHIPVRGSGPAAVVGLTLDNTRARSSELELRGKLELIERQQEVIREMSTPIIEVWDGVLTLPIVGLVDSVRTAELMDNLLSTVARTRSRFAILDITGVEVLDTGTAAHIIGMIQAVRLLGAEGVLTGIHPTIAQTVVALGVDLTRVAVFAKLRDALKHCIVQMHNRKQPRKSM